MIRQNRVVQETKLTETIIDKMGISKERNEEIVKR